MVKFELFLSISALSSESVTAWLSKQAVLRFSPSKEKKLNRGWFLPDSWFLFYEGENIRSHVFRWKRRRRSCRRENEVRWKTFPELCFFTITSVFPWSVPFSLDSSGIGNQITAGEKRKPNWHWYKYPTASCATFSVHHNGNSDPISELTHLIKQSAITTL